MKRVFRQTFEYSSHGCTTELTCSHGSRNISRNIFENITNNKILWTDMGEVEITLRLIGRSLPWCDWEWGVGEYIPNRFLVEACSRRVWFYVFSKTPNGRQNFASICRQVKKTFPGLVSCIGRGNTSEVEIIGKIA